MKTRSLILARFVPALVAGLWAISGKAASPAGEGAAVKVTVNVIPNLVKFDVVRFEVPAGAKVELSFSNECVMPHNLVIIRAAAEPAVIAAVNALGMEGLDKGFVPSVEGILAATKLLQPKQKQVLSFQAPSETGDYPYVCTFPGHWYTMRGVMKVVPKGQKVATTMRSLEKVENVPDALKDSGFTHKPLGTMDKPLVMRTFAPDPKLDPVVFAHHGVSRPAVKYDPTTRKDIFEKKPDPATGKMVEVPVMIPAEPGIAGAIAVNHGPEFSYVWDSTECRLMYAWRGGFLDMNPYWGKEPGSSRPHFYIPWIIGGLVYRASGSAPLAAVKPEVPQFGGYRMVEGAPEFWYRLGSEMVRERVIPQASGGFKLRVTVEGPGAGGLRWGVAKADEGAVQVREVRAGSWEVSFQDRPEAVWPVFKPAEANKKNSQKKSEKKSE